MIHIRKILILLICTTLFLLPACGTAEIVHDAIFNDDNIFHGNTSEENALNNSKEEAQSETIPDTPKPSTQTYIRSKVSLNIRNSASSSGKIVGKMDKNDMLLYLGQQNNWYKTIYKDKIAYVSASSLYSKLVEIEKCGDLVESVLNVGYPLLGYPYVWGSPRYHWGNGILNTNYVHGKYDCSALVQYMYFLGAGIALGLTTREQVLQGTTINRDNISRGDLLFFTNSSRKNFSGLERVGHVAIYLGNNYILHTASDFAVIEPITSARWNYFITAKRLV